MKALSKLSLITLLLLPVNMLAQEKKLQDSINNWIL